MGLKSILIPVCLILRRTRQCLVIHHYGIDQGHDTLSKSKLIQEQQTGPGISKLIFRALPEDEISQVPLCYYIKIWDSYEKMATI